MLWQVWFYFHVLKQSSQAPQNPSAGKMGEGEMFAIAEG